MTIRNVTIEYFKPYEINTFLSWLIWYKNLGYRIVFRMIGITISLEIDE